MAGILLFGFLILVHELGHLVAAKRCGVRVNEFAIGMGPRLVHWQRGETEYSLRLFPIGGFCAMEGEEDTSDDPRSFAKRPAWMRLIILCAGAAMNFLAGFLLLLVLAVQSSGFVSTTLDGVYEGFPQESVLRAGDQILAIDGERVYISSDINLLLGRGEDHLYDLELRRDGERLKFTDVPLEKRDYEVEGQTLRLYGIHFAVEEKSVGSVLKNAWLTSLDYVRLVRISLLDLFTGAAGADELMGPVGIVDTMNTVASQSESARQILLFLLNFGGLIAVNLAVMNLLPLPALDGGRVLFTLIEVVFRRPVPAKYENMVHLIGFGLLMALTVFVCYNDIARIVTRVLGG